MVKRILCAVCALFIGLSCRAPIFAAPNENAATPPSVSAKSAVLIEASTGEILYEKNAHLPMGMASTTKIMTALVALESAAPDTVITVPKEAVGVEGSSVYLTEGEQLTLCDLLYALLLSSANDAATAIAIAIGGSEEAFCARMNARARSLGLQSTRFANPHGLYDEEHYTTAYELAQITAEALSIPLFSQIVSTYTKKIPHDGIPDVRLLCNHNKLLRTYEGAIGVKTGFTKKTGRTLVSAAERDGMTLIAVTLDAPDDWRDHTALLDYGFASYEAVTYATAGELRIPFPVVGGTREQVYLTNEQDLTLILPKGHSALTARTEASGRFLYAPVARGMCVGTLTVLCDGQSVSTALCTVEATTLKRRASRFSLGP